jgi:hypothetical protein
MELLNVVWRARNDYRHCFGVVILRESFGSTVKDIWTKLNNIHHYKTYPRIVGETGGRFYAHSSANLKSIYRNIRGAFEFQGQKIQQLHELMYHKVCGQL